MVAVCDKDGMWSRRKRDVGEDGPSPHSHAFYQDYLQRYNLPHWFLRGGHLAMLDDTAEAIMLGLKVPEERRRKTLRHLDAQMPVNPARPLPRAGIYQIVPRRLEREYLGRRFPAILADIPRNTYVIPSGHVIFLSCRPVDKKEDFPVVAWNEIEWEAEDVSSLFASYKIESGVEPAVVGDNERRIIRQRLRDAHVADGGIVNPTQIPAGLGEWDWLDRSDRDVAHANNYTSHEDITLARGAGALSLNFERVDTPSVVFYPDAEYLNPEQQPDGPGRWAFLTSNDDDSDESFAALNLGGVHGLPNYPTASQIFRLRQQYRAQPNREDLTSPFRLVWIPGDDALDDEGADPVLSDLESETAVDEPALDLQERDDPEQDEYGEPQHGVLGPGIHSSDFDPTNGDPGGKRDQTAKLCKPRYYTCRVTPRSRIVTLDRARPEVGKFEDHKTWAYTRRGWQQYTHHAEIDWNDRKQLASLARWRDQLNRRSGWPNLRERVREAYAPDERRWMEELVRNALDAGGTYDVVKSHQAFNAEFGGRGERTEMAISSALLRIKRELAGVDGQVAVDGQGSDGGSDDEQGEQGEGGDKGQNEGGENEESGGALDNEDDDDMII
ncbi:hypothetical protein Q7P37_010496 [Cladosporium fusiforme]